MTSSFVHLEGATLPKGVFFLTFAGQIKFICKTRPQDTMKMGASCKENIILPVRKIQFVVTLNGKSFSDDCYKMEFSDHIV